MLEAEAVKGVRMSILLATFALSSVLAAPLENAVELFQRAEYETALRLLAAQPDKDGATHELIGRCHYMLGDPKQATEAFEKAVIAEPGNSDYRLWLGRAYGRRAETSSFITAPGFATKARWNFEKAIELNSRNGEAVNDLFEYYLEAPGILGGGLEKAAALTLRIKELDPAEYHYAQARLAEKRRQFQMAENQLRAAIQLAPKQVGRVLDLANFLAKQGRWDESQAAFRQAHELAPDSPKVLFDEASAYIHAGRNLDTAKELLKRYLAAPLTPDDPPRHEAQQLLKAASAY